MNCIDINGNTYQTAKIGKQLWMAENLKVTKYRNGDFIPNITDGQEWSRLKSGGLCLYDNDQNNYHTYGFLYNWYAVTDSRGLAPKGWHVPSDAEWQTLVDFLGGNDVAGRELKGAGLWGKGCGFKALPGGYRGSSGYFYNLGDDANFWSSTEYGISYAWYRYLVYSGADISRYYLNKHYGFSVRCVRD